ncbi:MAG: hypothetical protein P9M14_07180 [Candidatus Alcyoniella australis]|nr:hypothetical protein [Candidatus Alcyoniella australis]
MIILATAICIALALLLAPWIVRLRLDAQDELLLRVRLRSRLMPLLKISRVLYPAQERPPKKQRAPKAAKPSPSQGLAQRLSSARESWSRSGPYLRFARRHVLPQILSRINRLFSIVGIGQARLDLDVGLDDPEFNGYLCAVRGVLLPYLPQLDGLRVDFGEAVFEGDAELGIVVRPYKLAVFVPAVLIGTVGSLISTGFDYLRREMWRWTR